jgi:hypothetical protein
VRTVVVHIEKCVTSRVKVVDERGIRKYLEGSNPGIIELLFGKLSSKESQSQL